MRSLDQVLHFAMPFACNAIRYGNLACIIDAGAVQRCSPGDGVPSVVTEDPKPNPFGPNSLPATIMTYTHNINILHCRLRSTQQKALEKRRIRGRLRTVANFTINIALTLRKCTIQNLTTEHAREARPARVHSNSTVSEANYQGAIRRSS